MANETTLEAEDNRADVLITRIFDLPVDLLFRAYTDPDLVGQWMGTNVVKLENKAHGSWRFETKDPTGNVVFSANGTVHTFIPGRQIIRTFQIENSPFDVQLEFLDFESINEETSKLNMQIVYRSIAMRNQMLQLPFRQGLNMAHNRLQDITHRTT